MESVLIVLEKSNRQGELLIQVWKTWDLNLFLKTRIKLKVPISKGVNTLKHFSSRYVLKQCVSEFEKTNDSI